MSGTKNDIGLEIHSPSGISNVDTKHWFGVDQAAYYSLVGKHGEITNTSVLNALIFELNLNYEGINSGLSNTSQAVMNAVNSLIPSLFTFEKTSEDKGTVTPPDHSGDQRVSIGPEMHKIEITFWTPLPESLEMPIMERLVRYEDKFGWRFWTLNIKGNTLTVEATKEGSVILAIVIAGIIAVAIAIIGFLIVKRIYVTKEAQIMLEKELSEERQAVEETKQQVISSDLNPEDKAKILEDLTTYQQQITPTTPADGNLGFFDKAEKLMLVAVVGALVISLTSRR